MDGRDLPFLSQALADGSDSARPFGSRRGVLRPGGGGGGGGICGARAREERSQNKRGEAAPTRCPSARLRASRVGRVSVPRASPSPRESARAARVETFRAEKRSRTAPPARSPADRPRRSHGAEKPHREEVPQQAPAGPLPRQLHGPQLLRLPHREDADEQTDQEPPAAALRHQQPGQGQARSEHLPAGQTDGLHLQAAGHQSDQSPQQQGEDRPPESHRPAPTAVLGEEAEWPECLRHRGGAGQDHGAAQGPAGRGAGLHGQDAAVGHRQRPAHQRGAHHGPAVRGGGEEPGRVAEHGAAPVQGLHGHGRGHPEAGGAGVQRAQEAGGGPDGRHAGPRGGGLRRRRAAQGGGERGHGGGIAKDEGCWSSESGVPQRLTSTPPQMACYPLTAPDYMNPPHTHTQLPQACPRSPGLAHWAGGSRGAGGPQVCGDLFLTLRALAGARLKRGRTCGPRPPGPAAAQGVPQHFRWGVNQGCWGFGALTIIGAPPPPPVRCRSDRCDLSTEGAAV